MDGQQLQEQYKDYLSDYHQWDQKGHADKWLLYPQNAGGFLSIDETSLSNGELYTIITNKISKERQRRHCSDGRWNKDRRVTDRFHVQQLAYDAVQELRIKHRWEALDRETIEIHILLTTGSHLSSNQRQGSGIY